MKTYPIKSDSRYTIAQEFCGHAEKRHVLRFCGEFIASSISHAAMVTRAVGHNTLRKGAVIIEETKATA